MTIQGRAPGHIYGRNTNPTVEVFEEKIRFLEDAEAATSFATGMAAVSNTLLTLLSPNDRVVSIKDSYGGTSKVFLDILPRFKINVTLCDTTDHKEIELEIAKGCQIARAPRTRHSKSSTSNASPARPMTWAPW